VALGQVDTAVDGTVLTGTVPLVGQAIVLRAIGEGEAVTAESVVAFPTTVVLCWPGKRLRVACRSGRPICWRVTPGPIYFRSFVEKRAEGKDANKVRIVVEW